MTTLTVSRLNSANAHTALETFEGQQSVVDDVDTGLGL